MPLRTGISWVDLQLADLHGDAEWCFACAAIAAIVLVRRGTGGEWWAVPCCEDCAGKGGAG